MAKFNQKNVRKLLSSREQKRAADKRIEEGRKLAQAGKTPLIYKGKDKGGGIFKAGQSVIQTLPGETLADVAERTGRTLDDILNANQKVAALSTGMGIKVPPLLPEPGERGLVTTPPALSIYRASEAGAGLGTNASLYTPTTAANNLFSPVAPANNLFSPVAPTDNLFSNITPPNEAGSYLNTGGAGIGFASSGGTVGGYGLANAATVGKNTGEYAYLAPNVQGNKWQIKWVKDQFGNWVKKTVREGKGRGTRLKRSKASSYTYTSGGGGGGGKVQTPTYVGATTGKWSISGG